MLGALERRTKRRTLEAAFQFNLALVANSGLTEESFKEQQENGKERYFDLLGTYRPWEGRSYVDRKSTEFKDARQAYIDNFGVDPLDPRFKEWEAQTIAGFGSEVMTESADELVTRRLRERITGKDR